MSDTTRNLDGRRVTRFGTVDKRHNNRFAAENNGKAYATFSVRHRPSDARPWHVMRTDTADNTETLISRHTSEATALKHAERHRIKQPDRKASRKLKHVLGMR